MAKAAELEITTLGSYAYQAIQKHFNKILKYEKTVKNDKDPEALHQMRVGMRRLRSAVNGFTLAIDLPLQLQDKNIQKIARSLGHLRDLDVLIENLENTYQPHLPVREQEALQAVFTVLEKQRKKALSHVKFTLKGECYKSFKKSSKQWLEEPLYQPSAWLSIEQVLADLLLPELSRFLLHPGLLVGTQIQGQQVFIIKNWQASDLEKLLAIEGEHLHNIRKQAKRLRYQMELFTNLGNEAYNSYLADIKGIQDVLGEMQDSEVLMSCLQQVCKSDIDKNFPTLSILIGDNRYRIWQQWQKLQEKYTQPDEKDKFRSLFLNFAKQKYQNGIAQTKRLDRAELFK
ncbi:MAG: CHAD domain-containing protein [Cyanobacteria bacterium P01_A01_bin.45]